MVDLNKKTNAMFEVVQALSKENEQRKLTEYNQQVMQQQQTQQGAGENLSSVSENENLIQVRDNLNDQSSEGEYESDSESVDDSEDESENDNIEFRNIKEVTIQSSNDKTCKILFDKNHSIEDKILNEQFEY